MSSTRRLINRTKKLLYICFGGKWCGSETELTDWESVRRVFVVGELIVIIPIFLLVFWPISIYALGASIALGCLTVIGSKIYRQVVFDRAETRKNRNQEQTWQEYWKNREAERPHW